LLWTEKAVIALRSIPAVAIWAVKTKAEMERNDGTPQNPNPFLIRSKWRGLILTAGNDKIKPL